MNRCMLLVEVLLLGIAACGGPDILPPHLTLVLANHVPMSETLYLDARAGDAVRQHTVTLGALETLVIPDALIADYGDLLSLHVTSSIGEATGSVRVNGRYAHCEARLYPELGAGHSLQDVVCSVDAGPY